MTLSRRTLLAGAAAAPVLVRFGTAPAAGQAAANQVAALQKVGVGDAVVTAISDGHLTIEASFLSGIAPGEVDSALADAFVGPSPVITGVNAYLIQTGGRNVLVDAGGAGLSPTLGRLMPGLAMLGVKPADVSAVLLTHFHLDHIGALLADGQAAFPNADVHAHEREVAFWTNAGNRDAAPDALKPYFDQTRNVLDAYGARVKPFGGDAEVVPGIRSRELFGHTPGHSGFVVGTGEDALLIWGDVVHVGAIQIARPDVGIAFDVDAAGAAATRKRVLEAAAADRSRVAGMHLSFPGIGRIVKRAGTDGYTFEPSPWTYVLD